MDEEWWRSAVVYQVYIRSFADGNGDGTGDIQGLRNCLPYLHTLGIDAIWLNPWYESPLRDGGYDVADHRLINHRFGTNDDAAGFIEDAHAAGIKVIVDLVPNHLSDQHELFAAALASEPGDPARDRFHFSKGKGADGAEPPNNWVANFGGPAWERLPDGDWYLHLFDVSQPDLNWNNEDVRAEFDTTLTFWLDMGVDGFRVDVAHGLMKHPDMRDYRDDEQSLGSFAPGHPYWDRDEVHEVVRGWRSIVDGYDGDRVLVAEAWLRPERLPLYVRPDEYHLAFSFEFATSPWDGGSFRHVITNTLAQASSVNAPATWVLSNHDVVRHATRFGLPSGVSPADWLLAGPHEELDAGLGLRRARAAMLMMLALPGTAYIYQGDELGLPEVWDLPEEVLDDPIWEASGHARKGRDGCRVPLPWTVGGPSFGFGSSTGWLPQPSSWGSMSVEAQESHGDSTLNLCRMAMAVRRDVFASSCDISWLDFGPDVVAFERAGVTCLTNFGLHPIGLGLVEIVLSSAPVEDGRVDTDVTVWFRREE